MARTCRKVHRGRCLRLVYHCSPYWYVDFNYLPAPTYIGYCLVKCTNFAGIATIRFFLGLCESIIGPVFVIITSNWWTRPEQAFRTAFWLSGTPVSTYTLPALR